MPCTIDYDMVTKLETVEEDSLRVTKRIFNRTDIRMPPSYSTHKALDSVNAQLPEEMKQRLREKLKYELEMFGYEYK